MAQGKLKKDKQRSSIGIRKTSHLLNQGEVKRYALSWIREKEKPWRTLKDAS